MKKFGGKIDYTLLMAHRKYKPFYILSFTILVLGFFFIHMYHVSTLFENDRHFSHLSNLEREMTFRTEMGFYYHYYKSIVNAPSFEDGLLGLLVDNKTEYPDVINAVKRFNLYPEIAIAGLYRIFDAFTKKYDIQTKQCWEVSRGPTLPPVESCEGLGDPIYFYLEFVWYCAGLSIAVLFLYAILLSDSLTSGLLAAVNFLFNHSHSTRVQWTPPLRESFAYPFCLLQMLAVSYCLKKSFTVKSQTTLKVIFQVWSLTTTTMFALVLWQFSQFVIATQVIAILLLFSLGIIQKNVTLVITFSLLVGLLQAAVTLFGNELLFQSILFSLLLSAVLVVYRSDTNISFLSLRGIPIFGSVTVITLLLKSVINSFYGSHDAHIFDLLRSKLTNFKTFHTLLYTCAPEFDFLPFSTVSDLTNTGLLPISASVVLLVLCKWGRDIYKLKRKIIKSEKIIEPEIAYNILQLGAFTVMAAFIMRLKLFWTPHLCLIQSLIMSKKYIMKLSSRLIILPLLISVITHGGLPNLVKQWSIIGEYANLPFEEVLNWINSETLTTDVFAGPMSIMPNVLLSTGRRIVNHPHYEHPSIRERTLKVYSIFSRQPAEEVYSRLILMGVDYVILDESWCFARQRENCSMVDLWDIADSRNKNGEALCPKLFSGDPSPFVRVFSNDVFVILSLKARQFIDITLLQQYQI